MCPSADWSALGRLQGSVHMQMLQVGNAVPFLLCWAILGAVHEAAYGLPSPKPAFLAARQAATAAGKRPHAAPCAHPQGPCMCSGYSGVVCDPSI